MASTFHPFAKLPKELRYAIWDFAIRDMSVPGTHVFSLVTDEDNINAIDGQLMGYCKRGSNQPGPNIHPYEARWSMGAPVCAPLTPEVASWTRGNFSTYMEDGGLWTACTESRKRIGRHSKTVPSAKVQELGEDEEVQIMGYFKRDSKPQYFNLRPQQDLIVMQPRSARPIPHPYASVTRRLRVEHLPFLSRSQGVQTLEHFGLEYKPYWEFSYPRLSVDVWLLLCNAALGDVTHLWLIDYDIPVPKYATVDGPGALSCSERHVFHANGLKFVEVFRHEFSSGDSETDSIYAFVRELEPIAMSFGWKRRVEWTPVRPGCLGVLACERESVAYSVQS